MPSGGQSCADTEAIMRGMCNANAPAHLQAPRCPSCTVLCELLPGHLSAARLALDSQLWPVALLLSRLLGEAASAAAAAAMAEQCIAEGSPLQSLLLLLGGASPERPLAAAAAAAPAAGGPSGPPYPAADSSWPQSGVFRPAASSPAGAASWRRHLAVIAANRTPGDEAAMLTLGRQLLAAGQLLPAHICFVLAGALLQPWDVVAGAAGSAGAEPSGPPLVLLGADVANPRRCSRLDCILPTEVFTWSRTVGECRPATVRGAARGLCRRTLSAAARFSQRRRPSEEVAAASRYGLPTLLSSLQATPHCLASTFPSCPTSFCMPTPWQTWACCSRPLPTAPP